MAQPAKSIEHNPTSAQAEPARPILRAASAADCEHHAVSPAHALQWSVEAALHPPVVSRWSQRRAAAFMVSACGLFWLAVGSGLTVLP